MSQVVYPEGFTCAPNTHLDHLVKIPELFATYMVIRRHCYGTKDNCWPQQASLAEKLNCAVSTLRERLHRLQEMGYIKVTRGRFANTIHLEDPPACPVELRSPVHRSRSPVDKHSDRRSTGGEIAGGPAMYIEEIQLKKTIEEIPSISPVKKTRPVKQPPEDEKPKAILAAIRSVTSPKGAAFTESDWKNYKKDLIPAAKDGVTPEQAEQATRAAGEKWGSGFAINPHSVLKNLATLLNHESNIIQDPSASRDSTKQRLQNTDPFAGYDPVFYARKRAEQEAKELEHAALESR